MKQVQEKPLESLLVSTFEIADECYQKGRIDKAVEVLSDAIKHVPEEPKFYHCLAEIFIDSKNYKDACDTIHSMPEHAREELRSLELLGTCYEGLKDYEKAEQYAERVLSLKPSSAPALNLKGILAYRGNDHDKAADFLKMAIEADPVYGEPHTNSQEGF